MGRWTPLGAKHEGLVWPAVRSADALLATEGSLVGVIIPSTVAETIAKVHTRAETRTGFQRLAVDVYRTLGDASAHGGARTSAHQTGGGADVSPGGWYTMVTRQNSLTIEQADAENITIGDWWVPEAPPQEAAVINSHSGPFGIAKEGEWTVEVKRIQGDMGYAKAYMNRSLSPSDILASNHGVTPGLPYTWGAWAQSAPGAAGAKTGRVGFLWCDAGGVGILQEVGVSVVASQDNMLARAIVQRTAPAGAHFGVPFVEQVFTNSGAADSSQSVFFDGMMRVQGINLPGEFVVPGFDFEVPNSTSLPDALAAGDGVRATGTGFNEVEFPLDISPGTFDGKRIAGLKLVCVARSVGGTGDLVMSLRVNGNLYRGQVLGVGDDQRTTLTHESYWSRNPDTREPWTPDEIEAFAEGGDYTVTLHWEGGNALATVEVTSFVAQIFYVDETRIAFGHSTYLDPLVDVDVAIPLDATFAKGATDTLFLVFRKDVEDQGLVRLYRPDSGAAAMPLGWAGIIPKALSVNGFGDVGIIDGFTAFPDRAVPLVVLERTGGTVSVDSQPYARLTHDPVGTSEQEFTPEEDMPAGAVIAAVRVTQPTLDVPDATVRIRQGHGGLILATATVRARDLDDPVDQFQIAARTFADVTLDAGTQYVIEASSAAPASDFFPHWEFGVLEGGDRTTWDEQGYGGVDNAFTNASTGGRQPSKDAVAWVATKPDAVTLDDIAADTHPSRIGVAWSTTDEADFWYYELQRSDTDAGYTTVARFFERAATSFVDGAGRLGIDCSYRVRVVRTDWAPSDWSNVLTETMPPVMFPACPTNCFYSITAPGIDPDRWVECGDLSNGQRTYTNPDDLTVIDLAGSDAFGRTDSVAFRSPGRVLDRFSITAMVYGGDGPFEVPPDLVGREAFNDLVDLSFADAPYIVVRDSDGNRWYAAIRCNDQLRREPAGIYTVDVNVSELTRAPFPLQLIEGGVLFSDSFAVDVGDGTSLAYTVTHNLGTRDVVVRVYHNDAPYGLAWAVNVGRPTVNTVTVTFPVAPALDAYRVVIFA